MNFNNLNELYQRLLPALKLRISEVDNITEKELWDYLAKTIWVNSKDLTLADMVNDILKCDITLVYRNKI